MRLNVAILSTLALLAACNGENLGGDSERFEQWRQQGANKAEAAALQNYLSSQSVEEVIPIRQLLRSDTQWRKCDAEPYDVPPKTLWSNMVTTLQVIRDEVQPLIGPVEALSVYRNPIMNQCTKGATRSYHLQFLAIDMKPVKKVSRAELIEKLCALHASKGRALNIGLGIYSGTRFHIDTAGYRRWGHDHTASTSPCASFVAPQRKNR